MFQSTPRSNDRLTELLDRVAFEDLSPLFDLYKLSQRGRPELVTAIRAAGSHSLGGIKNYDEIVINVAKKMKVNTNDPNLKDELGLELLIVQRVFREYFDKLSPEERANMEREIAKLGMKMADFNKLFLKASAGALVNILAIVNGRVLWQVLSRILATIMTRYAAGAAAYRAIGAFWAAVPVVNALFGAWLVWDLLGPAYRKTIPAVVQIGLLRLQFADSEYAKEKSPGTTSPSISERSSFRCCMCGRDSGLTSINGAWYCSGCLPKQTGQTPSLSNALAREQIEAILRGYTSHSGVYIAPHIAPHKVRNASAKYPIPASETILVLIDTTSFGGASEGVAFGTTGVYFRNYKENATGHIPYSRFLETEFRVVSDIGVRAGNFTIDAGYWVKSKVLCNMLSALKRKIGENTSYRR